MPNWCFNSISISGPADKIKALWEAARAKNALLECMVPVADPADAREAWGIKWDVPVVDMDLSEGADGTATIYGSAESAWCAPINAFSKYAAENPDCYLELKYFEPGVSFIGVWDSEGGDAYWEDVHALLDTTYEEDAVLAELLEDFQAWDWYEEENLEIELDD